MASVIDQDLVSPWGKALIVRSRREVHLGPLRVVIRSNETEFSSLRYFPCVRADDAHAAPHFTLNFCNRTMDGPWPAASPDPTRLSSYRAKRFAAGYYITDHFGAPASLVLRGREYWVLGEDFEPIVWPYFVKWLLTWYSLEYGMLHLKAASVDVGGAGTLLIGRGGSGKTVLLTRLCQEGARFLSNTHSLIDGENIRAVPAAMRVRKDVLFGPVIVSRRLRPGIKSNEYVADPGGDLGWSGAGSAPLRNICLVDYRAGGVHDVREMDPEMLLNYMEQFSLALNVYGLKEDMLDHLGGDIARFSRYASIMKIHLRRIVEQSRRYYVSCDAMDAESLGSLRRLLQG